MLENVLNICRPAFEGLPIVGKLHALLEYLEEPIGIKARKCKLGLIDELIREVR
jgi:hypothetical protein